MRSPKFTAEIWYRPPVDKLDGKSTIIHAVGYLVIDNRTYVGVVPTLGQVCDNFHGSHRIPLSCVVRMRRTKRGRWLKKDKV